MFNFIFALFNVVSDKVNSSGVTGEIDPVKIWFKEYYIVVIIIFVIGTLFGLFLNSAIRFLIDFFRENRDIPEDDKKEDE